MSAVIHCLSNFRPFSGSSPPDYAILPVLSHSQSTCVCVHTQKQTLPNSESISRHIFQLRAQSAFVFWHWKKKHTNSLSLAHFFMHMLHFRHTGGSLHNVWMWGCPARGDGGEADVLSALLHLPVLSWWGESPAEERGRRREGREAEAWRRLWGASH